MFLSPTLRAKLPFLTGTAWLLLVAVGFRQLLRFGASEGTARAPSSWPADVPCALDPLRPTLVLFLHPLCPCSQSSVSELERLAARLDGRVRLHVFVYDDAALGSPRALDALRARLERIQGASVWRDPGATLAARFGAETSGQALLFATDGRLLFAGGITPERGAEGDNDGTSAILARVGDPSGPTLSAPVFGCALLAPERAEHEP